MKSVHHALGDDHCLSRPYKPKVPRTRASGHEAGDLTKTLDGSRVLIVFSHSSDQVSEQTSNMCILPLAVALLHLAFAPSVSGTPSGLNLPIVGQVLTPILDLAALPPPTLIQTMSPSPQCAKINQGQLMCCRGTVAGDLQPIVWLAAVYGYNLNPNDINGLDCMSPADRRMGVDTVADHESQAIPT